MVADMTSYAWQCLICGGSVPDDQDRCGHCGCPSRLEGKHLAFCRAEYAARRMITLPNGPLESDELAGAAFTRWWHRARVALYALAGLILLIEKVDWQGLLPTPWSHLPSVGLWSTALWGVSALAVIALMLNAMLNKVDQLGQTSTTGRAAELFLKAMLLALVLFLLLGWVFEWA
jgi:hypothetical protein